MMKKISAVGSRGITLFFVFLISTFCAGAQTELFSGKVTDFALAALSGATVRIKGMNKATKTNEQGVFTFLNVKAHAVTLVVSFVGYGTKEVKVSTNETALDITLEENAAQADEVIVTGVFDKRKRMEASVAISTISSRQIERLAPVSAADLLKNVPGVYVNSSLGEIRNTVYSRGISVGSNDGASDYSYVSMQEDGLPVTNATYGNYGPDYFLLPDATLGRLEAVRGGTASILGNNAPGGLFNYVMKEGGAKTEGEVRTKYGLKGNGRNNFYRADANVSGPLGHNFFYDAGGFYRYDEGNRYPGYPMNKGGQLYVHRKLSDGDCYWVNNRNDKPETFDAIFRVAGKVPQIWHPENGKIEPASYTITKDVTKVHLNLSPNDGVFVVFQSPATKSSVMLPVKTEKDLMTIEGSWHLAFQPNRGAPASANFDKLMSYTESSDDEVKYFSGTATYTKIINVPANAIGKGSQVWLDLGDVKNLAKVIVNSKSIGVVWKKPFRMDVTDVLKTGDNKLEIKVTNLWVNRLIGDAQPGVKQKITYTSMPFYQASSKLLTSGLLGPVKLLLIK